MYARDYRNLNLPITRGLSRCDPLQLVHKSTVNLSLDRFPPLQEFFPITINKYW